MNEKLALMLEKATLARIDATIATLSDRYAWFATLPEDRKVQLAIQVINSQKFGLQKIKFGYDFLLHLLPWVIALIALLNK